MIWSAVHSAVLAVGLVMLVLVVRRDIRRIQQRRRAPSSAQMVNKHDEICSVAPWPHAGFCDPNGGPGVRGRMLLLIMLADEKIGRVDTITTVKVDRDTLAIVESDKREDEKCEGQD